MSADNAVYLDAYLERKGPLPYSKVGRIAIAILRQLEERARAGGPGAVVVIHPRRIRIVNGAVEFVDSPELAGDAFLDDSLAPYISPEELKGERADVRATLYSLGCTLFELLTGQKPFPWEDPDEVRTAHVEAPVPDPRGLNSGIPSSISTVVRRLLAKEPAERPSGPVEAIAEIQACLGMTADSGRPAERARPRAPAGRARPRPGISPRGREPGERRAPARRAPRASTRRGAAARLGAGVADFEEEPAHRGHIHKKPAPLFTYCGIGLGIFFSLLLLVHGMGNKRRQEQGRQERRTARVEIKKQRALEEQARDNPRVIFEQEEREAARQLQMKLSMQGSPTLKKDALEAMLTRYFYTPSGRRMAEEFLKLHAMTVGDNRGLRTRKKDDE